MLRILLMFVASMLCLPLLTNAQTGPAMEAAANPARALSLYSVDLRDCKTEDFIAAAIAAGARPVGPPTAVGRVFSTTAIGVPNLQSFEVVSDKDHVVMVQFRVKGTDTAPLRRMLVAKYGRPEGKHCNSSLQFDGPYIGSCTYQWRFPGGMRLVFSARMFETTLSYVSDARLQELQQELERHVRGQSHAQARHFDKSF